jgi:cytochrome c
MSMKRIAVILFAAGAAGLIPAQAQFAYEDCEDWQPSDFRYVKLVSQVTDSTLREPVRMAFDHRGEGKSDIYFAERHGKIKRWDALTNEVSVLGELDVFSDDAQKPHKLPFANEAETGVNGIALDPGFKENRRIWIFYSPWEDTLFRLSRFTLVEGEDGKEILDMENEKAILEIKEGRKHAGATITIPGGPLAFDKDGNLWIAIGANSEQYPSVDEAYPKRSAEASSSNLADLRGSILRIRPDDNAPDGYTVPEGNLGEHWAAEFRTQGKNSLAEEYADASKVRPEIYVKGTRNPYSLNLDPKTGSVAWGDFGPNKMEVEELNLANHPIFAGYPYWSGKNINILSHMERYAGMDPAAPVSNSVWNKGPGELPPAEPATVAYAHLTGSTWIRGNHPTTGPVYRYDGGLDSPVKFPPHFEGAWMAVDNYPGVRMFKVNEAGDGYVDSAVFRGAEGEPRAWSRPIEMKQGPDGAVYVLDYAAYHATNHQTHIGRYEYLGSCKPGVPIAARPRLPAAMPRVKVTARTIRIGQYGRHTLRVRTLQGRVLATFAGEGPREYPVPRGEGGLLIVTLEPGQGSWIVPTL